MAGNLTGILLVDKPQGFTSHDVVAKLRRLTGERRIGHSGTLDPMATGLLVVFIGRATRAVPFAEADDKKYLAALRLGVTTDTQDITGAVLNESGKTATLDELNVILPRFRGELMQIPPMYSAIKINGRKLYDIARRGQVVERQPRKVIISRLEVTGERAGDFLLDITCSKGTYIRTLCSDIGEALGCGGCLSFLRRTGAGRFSIADAHTLSQVEQAGVDTFLLPVDTVFSEYPRIKADKNAEKCARVGAPFSAQVADGDYRVYSEKGEFLMLARGQDGKIQTIKSFFEV
ncbi:MAG TPA: tRNA pseudouridine(55) synthase TruB [Clostridiales bacterium]|nr:tRNA pseudouridine(55) synthase TruB [Clostridiales bacterium]